MLFVSSVSVRMITWLALVGVKPSFTFNQTNDYLVPRFVEESFLVFSFVDNLLVRVPSSEPR